MTNGAAPAAATTAAPPTATTTPAGPLQVAIVSGPKEGFTILFHDADGNVVGSTKTSADGTATAPDALAFTQVTALLGYSDFHKVVTWTDIARGDVLRVANVGPYVASSVFLGFSVTPPGDFTSATSYETGFSECYGGGDLSNASGTTPFGFSSCGSAQNAVLVEAFGASGDVVAFAFQKNLPAPTGDSVPVTLTNWVSPVHMIIDLANVDAAMTQQISLQEDVSSVVYSAAIAGVGLPAHDFVVPAGFADRYLAETQVTRSAPINTTLAITQVVTDPSSTIDYATALPEITTATADLSDPKRPSVTWASAAPLTSADGGAVHITWGTGGSSMGGPMILSPDSGSWSIYVAPGTSNAKAPTLPAEAAAWLPLEGSTGAGVSFDEIDYVASFADYRQIIAGEASVQPKTSAVRSTSALATKL